jgi:hypothetical protein
MNLGVVPIFLLLWLGNQACIRSMTSKPADPQRDILSDCESKSLLALGLQNDLHRSFEATCLGSRGLPRMT